MRINSTQSANGLGAVSLASDPPAPQDRVDGATSRETAFAKPCNTIISVILGRIYAVNEIIGTNLFTIRAKTSLSHYLSASRQRHLSIHRRVVA